ncbi:hypothetical protein [Streptomyces massasporeus]|uniref:hypothetical protein n=1 Tax=Streptomyces massasporeus TaxID=67324 RepID=UPI00381F092F
MVTHEGKRMTANGTTTIDRYAFGITRAKGMTGRHLKIIFESSHTAEPIVVLSGAWSAGQ